MSEEITLGPCMMALAPKRRRFVLAMFANPFGTRTDWARDAGYSDKRETKRGGIRVRAWEAYHDPKVQAACLELSRATLGSIGPIVATQGLLRIAADPKHRDHTRALELIANRAGLSEKQEIEVTHRDLTGDALIARIRALAQRHGLDAEKLLGLNPPKIIEHVPQAAPVAQGRWKRKAPAEHDQGGSKNGD
jgi:hypothetical protein